MGLRVMAVWWLRGICPVWMMTAVAAERSLCFGGCCGKARGVKKAPGRISVWVVVAAVAAVAIECTGERSMMSDDPVFVYAAVYADRGESSSIRR